MSVETPRATMGAAPVEQPVPVHEERSDGVLRDGLAFSSLKCLQRGSEPLCKLL